MFKWQMCGEELPRKGELQPPGGMMGVMRCVRCASQLAIFHANEPFVWIIMLFP